MLTLECVLNHHSTTDSNVDLPLPIDLITMKSSVQRLVKDQIALRRGLPPNYLFEDEDAVTLPDDLTQLLICLTGADSTPYSEGLWQLSLKIPSDYPRSPPTATFLTRIFHPNVDEHTGAVCLETLKRDWDPKLTLKDILVTISCLLIQPNADSALNAKAGLLIQEDYDAFTRQARLMTRIHAAIPGSLYARVNEARQRGDSDHTLQASINTVRNHDRLKSDSEGQVSGDQIVGAADAPKRPHQSTVCADRRNVPLKDPEGPHRKSSRTEAPANQDVGVLLKQPGPVCEKPLRQGLVASSTRLVFTASLLKGNAVARIGLRRL